MSEKKRVAVILGVTLAVWMGIRFLLPYVLPFLSPGFWSGCSIPWYPLCAAGSASKGKRRER